MVLLPKYARKYIAINRSNRTGLSHVFEVIVNNIKVHYIHDVLAKLVNNLIILSYI